MVSEDMLQAHIHISAARAVQRLLCARSPRNVPSHVVKAGTTVWVYGNTSAQNDPARWVKTKMIEAKEHEVVCRRCSCGAPMHVAYEDIKIAPNDERTHKMLRCSLEDILA